MSVASDMSCNNSAIRKNKRDVYKLGGLYGKENNLVTHTKKIFLHIFNNCEIIVSVPSDMSCNNIAIRKKSYFPFSHVYKKCTEYRILFVNTPIIYHCKCIMPD